MRDADVRAALRKALACEHASDPATRIVEEMGLWQGSVRIDVAVINGELCGYEIKSDRDTLDRLPGQAEIYSKSFDRVCLVVGSKHKAKARSMVPKWWGILVANQTGETVALKPSRSPKRNPSLDPLMLARLLWRSEGLEVLDRHGLARGFRSKPVNVVHERLASSIPLPGLSEEVRAMLRAREGWLGQPVRD